MAHGITWKNLHLRNPGIRRYLAGALLANGIRIFVTFFLQEILSTLTYLFMVLGYWSITIFSGAVAGFLLTRRRRHTHMLTGAVLGLYSYILYVVMSFFGFRGGVEDLWIFLGYLIGGLLGGRLGETGGIRVDIDRFLKL